jgi:endoglucanase
MDADRFCRLAGRLMGCPAAPYHEAGPRAAAEEICAQHGLGCERDDYGNLLVRLQTDPRPRPLVLAAHLDHPGFEIIRPISATRWLARFLGGVPDSFFRRGLRLRLMPGAIPAILGRRAGAEKQFEIHARALPPSPAARGPSPRDQSSARLPSKAGADPPPFTFAVWELADFSARRGRLYGRSCDDLIGVAALLATLIELKEHGGRVNVIGVISRAEEVGFQGALTVAASRRLPRNSLIVSLETSRELPTVKMGRGMILRVGDRTSIFDSAATRFLSEVAAGLSARRKTFRSQRALMSGGTCEATAYQEFGFQTAAVCIALGNYHNCGERGRIAAEFVRRADACGMVDLLVEAAKQMKVFDKLVGKLPARLEQMRRAATKRLRAD